MGLEQGSSDEAPTSSSSSSSDTAVRTQRELQDHSVQEKRRQERKFKGGPRPPVTPETIQAAPQQLIEYLERKQLPFPNWTNADRLSQLKGQLHALDPKQLELYGISSAGEYVHAWYSRQAQHEAMQARVTDRSVPNEEKQAARAAHIHTWRKTLFSCERCWLLPGLCVCNKLPRLPATRTRMVIHMHHSEWGKSTNTGTIMPICLPDCEMLLHGFKEHEEKLLTLLNDPTITTALLWPGADSLLPSELQQLADERTGGRVAVIAIDATWSNARRMIRAYPPGTLTVRLPPESVLAERKESLLRPVRKYRGDLEVGRVSTAEAAARLLLELEGPEQYRPQYDALLDALKLKVDAMLAQKNRASVYNVDGVTSDSGDDE